MRLALAIVVLGVTAALAWYAWQALRSARPDAALGPQATPPVPVPVTGAEDFTDTERRQLQDILTGKGAGKRQ